MNRHSRAINSSLFRFFVCTIGLILCSTSCDSEDDSSSGKVCTPSSSAQCPCQNDIVGTKTCFSDGSGYSECNCPQNPVNVDASVTEPVPVLQRDASQTQPIQLEAGSNDGSIQTYDASVIPPIDASTNDGATSQNPPTDAGNGSAGTSGSSGGTAGTGTSNPNDELDAVRQACVDHINMYRATEGLPPLKRATPEQEACSDEKAELDSVTYYTTGQPHTHAGQCFTPPGPQNTCPCLPIGGWGPATLEAAILRCLDNMWNEGMPAIGREACEADNVGADSCFMQHGHYLNMTRENTTTVSCGFYQMPEANTNCPAGSWWSNQDFDIQWGL